MELPIRSLRLFNRLFRKPFGFSAYRTVSNAAVKEEASSELLNSFNQDIKAGGAVPVFRRALLFPSRVALHDEFGTYTYAALYQAATALSEDIAAQLQGEQEYTISYMCSNDASHIVVQWAIWMTGNIAVPLTPLHPADMLKYYITDSGSNLIICLQDYEKILRPISQELSKPLLVVHRLKDGKDDLSKDQGKDEHSKEQGKDVYSNLQGRDELCQVEKENVQDDSISDVGPSNIWYGGTEAMLIYTSGTTSKPKGVVWTHNMLATQISSLHAAWQYSAQDVVLHTLPLHHIHGQLNSLNASLAAGARIRMLPLFASHTVWARLLGTGDREDARVSVFHGVPAMYARLAADYDKMFADKKTRDYVRATLSTKMRLMCAGSAALPETLFKKWEEISGMRLLERYGMSECGMALSNPYRPLEGRAVGHVGLPLPGVAARLAKADDQGLKPVLTVESPAPDTQISLDRLGLTSKKESFEGSWTTSVTENKQSKDGVFEGELLLKGPAVFTRYWNRAPKLDSPDFTEDGWFRTGDTASFAGGKFKILGRTSIDIIKTGGYKVSALQVESAILEHPSVADAAVVGVEDESYGEIISTVVVLKEKSSLTLRELKAEAGKKLAPYQLPKTMLIVEEMPRNAMGKLDKKEIKKRFGQQLVLKKK